MFGGNGGNYSKEQAWRMFREPLRGGARRSGIDKKLVSRLRSFLASFFRTHRV